MRRKPAIIVATPGRLIDFIQQKVVNISSVDYFILDEVDRMLDM
ncbi:MAG: DEAD/DEAH box helicase [bacterium]|nr:DEAD/DEAH box helicase [bacterium]